MGDLAGARGKLGETLRRIEEESKRLFLETFEEIRAAFQKIFRQLFGGGRADVKLAEGEDVMDAGVDIMAPPPGREMLPIGLLSGGHRTMTALALLFAVFECRPSPFCVLDGSTGRSTTRTCSVSWRCSSASARRRSSSS